MKLSVSPDVAEELAEQAESKETKTYFENIANGESVEVIGTFDSNSDFVKTIQKILNRDQLRAFLEAEENWSESLSDYDTGRVRGVLETLLLVDTNIPNDVDVTVSEEDFRQIIPKSMQDENTDS